MDKNDSTMENQKRFPSQLDHLNKTFLEKLVIKLDNEGSTI